MKIKCVDIKILLKYSDKMYNLRSIIKKETVDENNVLNNRLNTLSENREKEIIPFNAPTNVKSSTMESKEKKISFNEIEYLYNRYFSRSLNDTIIIISNILTIILLSNKYHKSRMDELFLKTDVQKERSDANVQHSEYKKVLNSKLKNLVKDLLSSLAKSEFKNTVKIIFLNIFKIFKILNQNKLNRNKLFNNLVVLLWKSLENGNFKHRKFNLILQYKSFYSECDNISYLIKDNRNKNLDITNHLSSYCGFIFNTQKYFKPIIDAVTSRSIVDLASLIDSCILEYYRKTLVKYQKNDYSSIDNCVIDKISETHIKNYWKHNKSVKLCMKAQASNETYQ